MRNLDARTNPTGEATTTVRGGLARVEWPTWAGVLTLLAGLAPVGLLGACDDEPPPPAVRVRSASELGVLEQSSLIQGRDGGFSTLAWGWSLWTYGDTVITVTDASGTNWHHNSVSYTQDLDAGDGISGFAEPTDDASAPGYLLHPTAEEEHFNAAHRGDPCAETPCNARWAVWPGQPLYDALRDRVLIPYELIYAEPGGFNFRGVGTSYALWDRFDAAPYRPVVDPSAEHPTLLFGEDEPGFTLGPQLIDDTLYAFACSGDALAPTCRLGRGPAATPLARDAWTFWDGGAWVEDWRDASPLFHGAPILSVAWNAYLSAWTAVYSEPLENHVLLRTAPTLTGPWTGPLRLFTSRRLPGTEGWTYDAIQHAEYQAEGGRVLFITHSRPTGVGWFGAEHALWRVELQRK